MLEKKERKSALNWKWLSCFFKYKNGNIYVKKGLIKPKICNNTTNVNEKQVQNKWKNNLKLKLKERFN